MRDSPLRLVRAESDMDADGLDRSTWNIDGARTTEEVPRLGPDQIRRRPGWVTDG